MADSAAPPVSLAGVSDNTNDQQAQILGAIAKYGQAGADAYDKAQQAVQANRQGVLNQIAGAQGIGGDAQSLLASKVQASTAPALNDLAAGQAALAADQSRSGDMYSKYMGEVQGAMPVIQGQIQQQATIRDAALQQAQQQLDAQAAAQAAQNAHDKEMAQLSLAQQQAQTQAAQANAAKAQSTASGNGPITATQGTAIKSGAEAVAGAYAAGTGPGSPGRSDVTDDMMMTAEDRAAYNGTDPTYELANIIAQQKGISPQAAQSYLTPDIVAEINGSKSLNPPPAPDLKAATTALKGDSGGAAAVLNGSRWPAVQSAVAAIANAPRDANGLISDGSSFSGLTPWAAFSQWITSPAAQLAPGDTKTPTVATATYKPFLSALK